MCYGDISSRVFQQYKINEKRNSGQFEIGSQSWYIDYTLEQNTHGENQ